MSACLPPATGGHPRARLQPVRALLEGAGGDDQVVEGEAHAIVMPSSASTRFTAGRASTRPASAW